MDQTDDSTPPPPAPSSGLAEPARSVAADEALFAALVKADRSESLGPLVAGMARELNDLLTKILGAVTLAKGTAGEPPLAEAEKACLAARDIGRRMLGLARSGGETRGVVPVRDLFSEAAKIAGAGSAAEIAIEAPDGVDPVRVDRAQILQVFQNLIRNALESMSPPPQRPRVQLRAANTTLPEGRISGLPAGDYVEFEVRDNGGGIPAEHLEKIWDPFFTTKKHGAGLGLPTAVAIVRRHGGQIGVDSTPGVGTVFTIFLPSSAPIADVRAHAAPSKRFRSGRILVMDDDEQIRSLTGAMLQKLDYKADLARDGDEAVALYRRYADVGRPYDAVILDLTVVGGMGGEETFDFLRALDPDVRAIASGGGDADETAARCMALGFCGCLSRPYRAADLGKVLGTVLG
jgi:two-component system, cell cycle sensor histidine kinase and response regulator CckA